MNNKKEFMLYDVMIDAYPCTFYEYTKKYNIISNEYDASQKGYNVIISITDTIIFIPSNAFDVIAQPSEY